MAGYREHISVSGLLGVGYGAAAVFGFGFTPVQGALAGIFTWLAGMLPDLDSESGRPVRVVLGPLAAIGPFLLMRHLLHWAGDPEGAILLAILTYAAIWYGGALLLAKMSVHRGMFHSIPALLIAAEAVFLGYKSESVVVKLLMAGGVGLGFFSHLVLDEMYSVEWTGIRLKLNQAAGSALKLAGKKMLPNVFAYAVLALLTYATLVDFGILADPLQKPGVPPLPHATESLPTRR